jgi:hypothetical protein
MKDFTNLCKRVSRWTNGTVFITVKFAVYTFSPETEIKYQLSIFENGECIFKEFDTQQELEDACRALKK